MPTYRSLPLLVPYKSFPYFFERHTEVKLLRTTP